MIFCIVGRSDISEIMAQKKITLPAAGPVSRFIQHHYRHFNAAALVDAAKGYVAHLD